ncbi:class I SAM-dependent methyltransferase [Rhizobium sp. LjRoot254]|uniref:class I SAM-dependent methyltransferase n=1 Tax=Rhizobium sp. LjRoot254 TaxID=3342297 RepID=UPI003ECF8C11
MVAMFSVPVSEVVDVPSRADWNIFRSSPFMRTRVDAENGLVKYPFPCSVHAYCGCCNRFQQMEISGKHGRITPEGYVAIAFSESVVCPVCRINARMRFACEQLRGYTEKTANPKIYLTEKKTHLFQSLLANGFDCVGSEWLGADKVPGETYDGIEHQDVHALTFPDNTFDVVMSLDVLEHVNTPGEAISELLRVLKPDGLGIVTFPFFAETDKSVVRSRIAPDGTIQHVKPAEFHGNPLGGGSLVFTELSWDFIAGLQNKFGSAIRFVNYWSIHSAQLGLHRFALLLSK